MELGPQGIPTGLGGISVGYGVYVLGSKKGCSRCAVTTGDETGVLM